MILCVSPTPDDKRIYVLRNFREGEVLRAQSVHRRASGKGVNAASAIVCMGEDALLLSFAGTSFSTLLQEQLVKNHPYVRVINTRTPTRCCTTMVNSATGLSTELVEEAAAVNADEVTKFRMEALHCLSTTSISVAVLAGTLPPGCPDSLYAELCALCRERTIPVVVDAKGKPLLKCLAVRPTVVKCNREEAISTMNAAGTACDSTEAIIRLLLEAGAQNVVITDGNNVVHAGNADGVITIMPPVVQEMNAVGSGDAMTGGIALGLQRNYSFRDAVLLGMAMGSANATTLFPGSFNEIDAYALFEQLKER
jgi:1-phosphofructokinase family hexose kinase